MDPRWEKERGGLEPHVVEALWFPHGYRLPLVSKPQIEKDSSVGPQRWAASNRMTYNLRSCKPHAKRERTKQTCESDSSWGTHVSSLVCEKGPWVLVDDTS